MSSEQVPEAALQPDPDADIGAAGAGHERHLNGDSQQPVSQPAELDSQVSRQRVVFSVFGKLPGTSFVHANDRVSGSRTAARSISLADLCQLLSWQINSQ